MLLIYDQRMAGNRNQILILQLGNAAADRFLADTDLIRQLFLRCIDLADSVSTEGIIIFYQKIQEAILTGGT